MVKEYLFENTVKNLLLIVLFVIFYSPLVSLFSSVSSVHYNNILTTISILIVAALFADYGFTYSHSNLQSKTERYLAHTIAFLVLFCTGILLESVVILMNLETGVNLWIVELVAVLFYLSLILYDFWDLLRAKDI